MRLTTVELGTQFVSSYDANNDYLPNKTDDNLFHQSLTSNNEYIHLRENQLIRLTCVVSRALPAAILHFPFEIDYRTLRNSTIENADQTYRTILVLILRINRYYHQRKILLSSNAIFKESIMKINTNKLPSSPIHYKMDVACKSGIFSFLSFGNH